MCGVEADAGRTGAYYSLRSGWVLGQGRPKIQTVRNGARVLLMFIFPMRTFLLLSLNRRGITQAMIEEGQRLVRQFPQFYRKAETATFPFFTTNLNATLHQLG